MLQRYSIQLIIAWRYPEKMKECIYKIIPCYYKKWQGKTYFASAYTLGAVLLSLLLVCRA
jgi:hypothetical protein